MFFCLIRKLTSLNFYIPVNIHVLLLFIEIVIAIEDTNNKLYVIINNQKHIVCAFVLQRRRVHVFSSVFGIQICYILWLLHTVSWMERHFRYLVMPDGITRSQNSSFISLTNCSSREHIFNSKPKIQYFTFLDGLRKPTIP